MVEIKFIDGEPHEIVKDDSSPLHIADRIRPVEEDDALVYLLEERQELSVPSQHIDRNTVILTEEISVNIHPHDSIGGGGQDDGKNEFALDEIGIEDGPGDDIG